jgi:hypothetical protein
MGQGLLLEMQGQTVAVGPAFTHAGHGEGGVFHRSNFLDKLLNYFANYMPSKVFVKQLLGIVSLGVFYSVR